MFCHPRLPRTRPALQIHRHHDFLIQAPPPHLHTSPSRTSRGRATHEADDSDADYFYWDFAGARRSFRPSTPKTATPVRPRVNLVPTPGGATSLSWILSPPTCQGAAPLFLFPLSAFLQNFEPQNTSIHPRCARSWILHLCTGINMTSIIHLPACLG